MVLHVLVLTIEKGVFRVLDCCFYFRVTQVDGERCQAFMSGKLFEFLQWYSGQGCVGGEGPPCLKLPSADFQGFIHFSLGDALTFCEEFDQAVDVDFLRHCYGLMLVTFLHGFCIFFARKCIIFALQECSKTETQSKCSADVPKEKLSASNLDG